MAESKEVIEKARLLKLGDLVINHIAKQRSNIAEVLEAKDTEKKGDAVMAMQFDAQQLLVLGVVLGADGRHFTRLGKSTSHMLFLKYDLRERHAYLLWLVDMWKDRQLMTTAAANDLRSQVGRSTEDVAESMHAWCDDFLRVPAVQGRRKCTFCGEAEREGRKLQACGSCKAALYCDRKCQKMHWKEHKGECQVTVKEDKGEGEKIE